jgi:hypothetical protein
MVFSEDAMGLSMGSGVASVKEAGAQLSRQQYAKAIADFGLRLGAREQSGSVCVVGARMLREKFAPDGAPWGAHCDSDRKSRHGRIES